MRPLSEDHAEERSRLALKFAQEVTVCVGCRHEYPYRQASLACYRLAITLYDAGDRLTQEIAQTQYYCDALDNIVQAFGFTKCEAHIAARKVVYVIAKEHAEEELAKLESENQEKQS